MIEFYLVMVVSWGILGKGYSLYNGVEVGKVWGIYRDL